MKAARKENMLIEFVRRWSHHKVMNKWLWRMFQYLVRARRFPALCSLFLDCFSVHNHVVFLCRTDTT